MNGCAFMTAVHRTPTEHVRRWPKSVHTEYMFNTAAVFHAPMFALNADADWNACEQDPHAHMDVRTAAYTLSCTRTPWRARFVRKCNTARASACTLAQATHSHMHTRRTHAAHGRDGGAYLDRHLCATSTHPSLNREAGEFPCASMCARWYGHARGYADAVIGPHTRAHGEARLYACPVGCMRGCMPTYTYPCIRRNAHVRPRRIEHRPSASAAVHAAGRNRCIPRTCLTLRQCSTRRCSC